MPRLCCIPASFRLRPTHHGERGPLIRRSAFTLAALLIAASGCREDAESPTAPEPQPALAAATSAALAFQQLSAGFSHNCGLTLDGRAYCWGQNQAGQLGDGTTLQRLTPVAVVGGLRFRQVSAGARHTCGLTPINRAYCWGQNQAGQLGDGTTTDHLKPVAVVGGLRFLQVSPSRNGDHTCGVATDSLAYCWGANDGGQLGDGTMTSRLTPVRVAGGLRFHQVTTSGQTCGVTTSNRAYCWGPNSHGQLGDGTTTDRLRPVAVAGGLRFREVHTAGTGSCAVTPGDRAYCWGLNFDGQLGDGTTTDHLTPVPVVGGLLFRQVSVGENIHTCGVTLGNIAYCWGYNGEGALGDGTATSRLRPVRVAGGLRFRHVRAGEGHTCGLTTDYRAYCWGYNGVGALGDGTVVNRLAPVAVAGPM
jgi:alpha-tubulin suppressor-like RCC1 family protein